MRCVALCIANSFKLSDLAEYFKAKKYDVDLYRNILQVSRTAERGELFFFAHGTYVMWGFTSAQEREMMARMRHYAQEPTQRVEVRYFSYRIAAKTRVYSHKRFQIEMIDLEADDSQTKLAISYGLAQSVKLEFFEETVQRIVRQNTPLFEVLANTGKVPLKRVAITRRMGEILLARSMVNLHSEYLDTPEYFWEYPNLENDYLIATHFLDISPRVVALNQQLDVLHELFNMLTGQLQHQHSSFLEVIIIALIGFEIALSCIELLLYHHL